MTSTAALKFAVVREDPRVELHLVDMLPAKSTLVVASGGCTALTLASVKPALQVTAFDLNPTQLLHVEAKRVAAMAGDTGLLNVSDPRPDGLNQSGAFEALFRVLRGFIEEFVASPEEIATFFCSETRAADRTASVAQWAAASYWKAAFATCFNDEFLVAMFGRDAIQHAAPGSYPGYFQAAFERGLGAPDAHRNPFLQHVLLGCYLAPDAPAYVMGGPLNAIELVQGSLGDVPDLDRFSLFSLSNIFDWSSDDLVAHWASLLTSRASPGAAVVIRQLNNNRDVQRFFSPAFAFDDTLGAKLWALDRSLFYQRIHVGFRR